MNEGTSRTILRYLRGIDIFEGLSVAHLRKVARITEMELYVRKEKICVPGDSRDDVFFLIEGHVVVSTFKANGRRVPLRILQPGEVWGDKEALQQVPRKTLVEALDEVLVCVIRRKNFYQLIQRYPHVAANVAKSIAARLQDMDGRVEDFVLSNVRERLAHLLVTLAGRMGTFEEQGIRLKVKLTHDLLASTIGTARETVSMLMRQFVRRGLILQVRRYIVIPNPDALREGK